MTRLSVTVVIPTLGREEILLSTIEQLLRQNRKADSILVLDQTVDPPKHIIDSLTALDDEGSIQWIRGLAPSQPGALNEGLRLAKTDLALFIDDDIRIEADFVQSHVEAFENEGVWAVAGQVLQPNEIPDERYVHKMEHGPFADCHFCFRSNRKAEIQNGMSGNLSVRVYRARQIGGFDENFLPPVAYRFDNDFCKRLCQAGGKIVFEPKAKIDHLRASRGGTRSRGSHLTSASPIHGVGDYYFAMQNGSGSSKYRYIFGRLFREVRTRFHLKHPWWIPVKLVGEIRAIRLASRLRREGRKLLES